MSEYEDYENINPIKLYLDDVFKCPLLTIEEEKMHTKNLKLFDELKIVERIHLGADWEEKLDLDTIFLSCTNNNYKEIIDSLMKFFKNKEEYKDTYKKLKNYKRKSDELNRALTPDELNIENREVLDEKEILDQVKKYLVYQNSFDTMYRSNLALVASIAKKYDIYKSNQLDFINEGNLGLRRAIQKFDVDLNYKFSTYATHWIKQRITMFMISQKSSLSFPYYLNAELIKFREKVAILEQLLGHKASVDEISKYLNISRDRINELLTIDNDLKSLDESLTDDEDVSLKDSIQATDNVVKEVMESTEIENLYVLLDTIPEKWRTIIEYRYGFRGDIRKYQEIGDMLGISKQRVHELEGKALKKMKENSKNINWDFRVK